MQAAQAVPASAFAPACASARPDNAAPRRSAAGPRAPAALSRSWTRPARGQPARPRHVSCLAEPENGSLPAGELGGRVMVPTGEEMGINMECDENGCVLVVGKNVPELAEQESEGFLQCNLSGCWYGPAPAPTEFKVIEGAGWRLGYETAPATEDSFSAMVGAGGWSIALTAAEFHDFCKLIQMLRKGIITMDQDGVLGRDDIVMQVEKGSLWMECVVPKKTLPTLQKFLKFGKGSGTSGFEIRFILTGKTDKRQAEGYWPADAVMDMLRKLDQETDGAIVAEGNIAAAV